jgi:hypothetical protein
MKILHPTDFSEYATKAEAVAVDLVGKVGGELECSSMCSSRRHCSEKAA